MSQEKTETKSPFVALTWQEQQDKWLAWRSRQLDYQAASAEEPRREDVQKTEPPGRKPGGLPSMRMPNMRIAAPTRHQELDEVINRHRQALKKAGPFQTTAID